MTNKIRAVQYVRMSTEHQQYSTENQADVIRDYATKHEMDIVRTYADEGKSGLRMQGRDALKEVIETVRSGKADFTTILVYDVSRWGRFQDADESAFLEYTCKRAGITVQYCAEQFTNDGTVGSTIIKTVKRAMAGEYSRELSAKVFKGQCRLIEMDSVRAGPRALGYVACSSTNLARRKASSSTASKRASKRTGSFWSLDLPRRWPSFDASTSSSSVNIGARRRSPPS